MEGGSSLAAISDDLILVILDFTDVRTVLSTVARSCQKLSAVAREWMPWRCTELRHWVSIPSYQSKMGQIYTDALSQTAESCTSDELHMRQLAISVLLGQAGLYLISENLLNAALEREKEEGRAADLLHALADVLWKAQQARQGGGMVFLNKIVTTARRSILLRRQMGESSAQRRKLALTLEIFAENSACYAHYVDALEFPEAGAGQLSSVRQHVEEALQEAEEAAKECIQLWADDGDLGKLADAWAAFAAVDFYAGKQYGGAMAKLRIARTICTRAHGPMHSTMGLILFNMGYITQLVFGDPRAAADLFSESLRIREGILGLEHPFTIATRDALLKSQAESSAAENPGAGST